MLIGSRNLRSGEKAGRADHAKHGNNGRNTEPVNRLGLGYYLMCCEWTYVGLGWGGCDDAVAECNC